MDKPSQYQDLVESGLVFIHLSPKDTNMLGSLQVVTQDY